MSQPLLIVDVQVGFINTFTHHIPQRIVSLIERDRYSPLLFTRFVNAPDGPYNRFLNWHSCNREPETDVVPELQPFAQQEFIFSKLGLCGMPDELTDYLRQQRIEQISIVGIDTDMCVLKIAMDLFDIGIEPIVFTDCCASTAGLQAHLAGLAVLSRNIGAMRLRDAGLSGGSLAAP
ncbi:cysteine hydrolase family protein [Allocoleopsis franciscana]|uniref:Nicotinamidase-like amidase n=1 Tax=Allocoleopsis franciscana PCC 7113 TaxID=1173027 RepID=K9W8M8_9CYAN|nr:isochorismatase family cysteine hydrolase [Allocoleopsis franciscana]AFZ16104.1 nicotinamidase-like amidase [Allocoleopsis franciscana PCC 7113]